MTVLTPYSAEGAGTPVLFLHGLGSRGADWALQTPVFAGRHRALTVDLRFEAAVGQRARTVEDQAEALAAMLSAQGAAPAHVVGLSLGGCVAQALAIRHAAVVRSLVLVNTFARYRPAGLNGVRCGLHRLWLLQFGPMAAVARFVAEGLFPNPDQATLRRMAEASLGRNTRAAYWTAIRAVLRFDARPGLAGLRCPTLVVLGDRDRTVPRAAGEYLAAHIPGARRLEVRDSGHATPMDQPEVFNREVLAFCAAVEAG